MPLLIDADVQDGTPRLHVLDAQSGHLRLAWHAGQAGDSTEADLHMLFRQLMLLSEIDPAAPD